jgi:hypothetical protein
MNALLFILAELGVMLAGFGAAVLLAPTRPVSRMELAGISLVLGQGVISLALFALSPFFQGNVLIAVMALFCLALGILGILRCRRVTFTPPRREDWWCLIFVPMLAAIGWQAITHPLTADGLFNFEWRAQLAAQHGGEIPVAFFSDPSRTWAHPGYPLFLPLNQTWIYLCIGQPHQGLGQLLAVHFALAAMYLLYAGLRDLTGQTWRGALAVVLLFLLPAATTSPGGAASLWADFPLAVVFLGAVIYLIRFSIDGSSLSWFAAFLALLPWVKREGVVLAAVLAVAFLWIAWRAGKISRLPLALFPLAIVWCGWTVFLHGVHATGDRDFLPFSVATIAQNLDRLPLIQTALFRELLETSRWSLLWPLTAVAAWLVWRAQGLAPWRILPGMIVALLALYSAIYLLSAWPSLGLHLVTSLPRLLLSVAMPAILLLAATAPSVRPSFQTPKDASDSTA